VENKFQLYLALLTSFLFFPLEPPNGTPDRAMSPVDSPNAPPPPVPVGSNQKMAAQGAIADAKNIVRRKLTGYVGFANLPNQWHRKSVRKGFNFNVMVVGMFFCIRRRRGVGVVNDKLLMGLELDDR
jgi:hypothetical protein